MFHDPLTLTRFPKLGRFGARYFADDDGTDSGDEGGTDDAAAQAEAERQKVIAESKKYRKRAQEAEAQIKALEENTLSDDDRELFETLKAEKAKAAEDQAKAEGQYDTLLQQKQQAFDEAKVALETERDTYRAAFERVSVTDRLKGILAGKKVTRVNEAAFLLQGQFAHYAVAELVSGEAVVKVVDRQGQPVTDADCKPGDTISVEKLVDAFLASESGQVFLPPSGDSGSGGHAGGEGDTKPNMAELEADDAKRAAFVQEHGAKEYMELLRKWKLKHKDK